MTTNQNSRPVLTLRTAEFVSRLIRAMDGEWNTVHINRESQTIDQYTIHRGLWTESGEPAPADGELFDYYARFSADDTEQFIPVLKLLEMRQNRAFNMEEP